MLGAIIGDIVGSRFEFDNTFDYNFKLFSESCSYTDDTICTVAIADAILKGIGYKESILYWCRRYPRPMGAYGVAFSRWLHSIDPQPYDSFGNGAAMRVGPTGWAFGSKEEVARQAKATAAISHSHPEGLRGAAVVALGIYELRQGENNVEAVIESLMQTHYGRGWQSRLPRKGVFDETCQGCVPLAFDILCRSTDFEDAIRKAVSYGGDSDTLGAIVGSLAEACWPINPDLSAKALSYLPDEMKEIVDKFYKTYIL